jgi:primosomal protein N'
VSRTAGGASRDGRPTDIRAGRLRHVRWIGGAPGAGKTTTARQLAEKYGLQLYLTDDTMAIHAARTTAQDSPYLAAFAKMSMDERWLNRSPQTMLDTFHWFRGEAFDLIVDDLLEMPNDRPIVAEGFRLLPHLIEPLLTKESQALWLLPNPELNRPTVGRAAAATTTDPDRAHRNLRERDRLFAYRMERETKAKGLRTVEIDPAMPKETVTNLAAKSLGLIQIPTDKPQSTHSS